MNRFDVVPQARLQRTGRVYDDVYRIQVVMPRFLCPELGDVGFDPGTRRK